MAIKEVKTDYRLLEALRNTGYDGPMAIEEFIDNSIEEYVGASFADITIDSNNNAITCIYCADNGCGMDEFSLDKFFSPGYSPKDRGAYGCYGLGGKTAGISLGRRIRVLTKQPHSQVSMGVLDLDINAEYKKIIIDIKRENEEGFDKSFLNLFYNKVKNPYQGTLIMIEKLDRVTQTPPKFLNTLKVELSKTYTEIIKMKHKMITVNGEDIELINYVGGKNIPDADLIDCQTVEFDNSIIGIEIYDCKVDDPIIKASDYDIKANAKNNGIYAFRNGRLVGQGVKFKDINDTSGDGHSSSFRCKLYFDGSLDTYFGSTFNKRILNANNIDSRLAAVIGPIISRGRIECVKRYDARAAVKRTEKDKETEKRLSRDIKKVLSNINASLKQKRATNTKRDQSTTSTTPTQNTKDNPIRNRDRSIAKSVIANRFFNAVVIDHNLRPYEPFVLSNMANGKMDIILNANSPVFIHFFDELTDSQQILYLLNETSFYYGLEKMANDTEIEEFKNILEDLNSIKGEFILSIYKEMEKEELKENEQLSLAL